MRIVRLSTVPAWPPSTSIESPTEIVSSMMMKSPVIRSATSDCAPKPTARPITPAPASNGVTFSPRFAAVTMPAIASSATNTTLRTSGSIVRARMLGPRDLPRAVFGLSASWIAVSIRIQISHTMKNVRMIALTACVMPRAATLSSASFASERPQKRDAASKNASQMPSTNSVPTNFTRRRTYADCRRGRCAFGRVMRTTTAERKNVHDKQCRPCDCHLQDVFRCPDAGERRDHRRATASSSIGTCHSDATISKVSVAARLLWRNSYERLRIR